MVEDTYTMDQTKAFFLKEKLAVQVKSQYHIKVWSRHFQTYVNFYIPSNRYHLDGESSKGNPKGMQHFLSYIQTGNAYAGTLSSEEPISPASFELSGFKNLGYKKLRPDAYPPFKAYDLDAGFDIAAVEDVEWQEGLKGVWYAEAKSGIAMEVPEGLMLMTTPRSSSLFLTGTFVFTSIVDTGYTGEISFLLMQMTSNKKPNPIKKGDRFAQVVYVQVPQISRNMVEVSEIPTHSSRGENRLGSSGKTVFDL